LTDNQAPADPLAKGDLLKDAPTGINLARQLRKRVSATTETYVAYGSTEALYKICAAQANYDIPQRREKDGVVPTSPTGEEIGVGDGWWYTGMFDTFMALQDMTYSKVWSRTSEPRGFPFQSLILLIADLKLTPTFNTWAQVTFLHMYILTVRMRLFPADHAPAWHQHLLDHFSFDAEMRMETVHSLTSRGIRARYLKDLFIQWRGVLAAYDEGLVKGDAVLAAAVWRNIFKAADDVNAVDLALVVSYLRREIAGVGSMSDGEIAGGYVEFGDPGTEKNIVLMQSHLMREDK
jgi:cytochrome b pre-mRNA-processing protein 3